MLGNLGALDEEDAIAFLGQALWLALHVQVPLDALLGLASALLEKIGFDAEPAPLFATAAVLRVLAQGQGHPEAEQLQDRALGLLGPVSYTHLDVYKRQGLGRRLYEWLDGPTERWLAGLRAQHPDLALHVDVENRLRHLPWELLYSGGHLCGHPHQRFTPVRRVNGRCAADQPQPANRPLRVLFMATSPEDVLLSLIHI